MHSLVKKALKAGTSAPSDSFLSREGLLAEVNRLRKELANVEVASKLGTEQYSLLFQNMSLGALEEDYSKVRKEVDKLISSGVDDIEAYFLDNPNILRDLVAGVRVTSINQALLDMRGADSIEGILIDEGNIDEWWNDEWIKYYASEIACLAKTNTNFGADLEDITVEGNPYVFHVSTFLVAGFEHSWERVISIHEDITDRRRMEAQIREAQNELEIRVEEQTRELLESETLLTQSAEMANLGYAIWDYADEKYITVSDGYAGIYGYSKEEFLATFTSAEKDHRTIFSEDQELYQAYYDDDDAGHLAPDITFRIVKRDGDIRHILQACKYVYDASGERTQSLLSIQDITDRKLVEEELGNSHALYRQAEVIGNMGHWNWDHKRTQMISCSEQLARIYEMTVPETIAYFSSQDAEIEMVHLEDRERFSLALSDTEEQRGGMSIEYRIITPSGVLRHVYLRSERVFDDQGTLVRSFGTLQDITERKQIEQDLLIQSQITSNMVEGALLVRGSDATIIYTNLALEKMFGYDPGELLGKHISILNAPTEISPEETSSNLIREIKSHGVWSGEIRNTKKDGAVFWCSVNISTYNHPDFGEVWISINSDTTERRRAEKKLSYQASHDILTGLINRLEFELRAERLISTIHEGKREHALCFMDLDQFKVVNDTCGHTAGDELLRQLGQVLQNGVRRRDTLARLGGDEFGVLMEHCSLDQAQRAAKALLKRVEDFQFSWEGHSFRIGISIGLVAITETTRNLNELLRQADAACYMAKDLGRNRIHVYRPEDTELAQRHGEMQWVSRINQALEINRFTLYAQNIVPLDDSRKEHYELLLRMVDEDGQIIPPRAFLPAAERYDLMEKLDTWVIGNAFALMTSHPAFVEQIDFVSINLSGQSLTNINFLNSIITQIGEFKIDASKICFEVTETAAISNLSAATAFISMLKDLGCRFALDDFGSGLSSFGYLKNLKVDYLKIDGMFVKNMVNDPIDHAMVKSIHDIGHVMGMKTIAEFVENDAIKDKLIEIGVDYVQGYGIGKPEPLVELISKFEDSRIISMPP